MKRRYFPSRSGMGAVASALAALAVAACGGDPSAKDATRLDAKALSPDDRMVAEALLTGFRHETGADALRDADIERAACYAKSVDMPPAFADAHKLYLADYAAIDADFYPWFEGQGVSMEDAWDIADRVKTGFDACAAE